MTREESLKEFVGYQTYDIQPSVEAVKVAVETLRIFTDNATNGDVIKALFPNRKVRKTEYGDVGYELAIENSAVWFDGDWWNAPYKRGDEDD